MGSKPKSTPPVNSAQVATQTNQANQNFAQLQSSANRVNQTDQFGNSLNYTQTGTDAQGNPIYSATQGQGALGQQYTSGLAGLGQQYFNWAGDPNNPANMQAFDKAGQLYDQTQGQYQDRQKAQLDTQLRNQGLTPGSEAYDNATRDLGQQQSDARNSFLLNGQNQFFNQTQQSLAPGVQFANNVLSPGYVNAPQVNTGQAYDPTQIAGINQQTALANTAAQNQYQNAKWGAIGSIAGMALAPMTGGLSLGMGGLSGLGSMMAPGTTISGTPSGSYASGLPWAPSDARLKDNIIEVGALHNGQKVYAYNFKGDPRTQIGLIAQEVMETHPHAVAQHPSGMLMVDYAKAVV